MSPGGRERKDAGHTARSCSVCRRRRSVSHRLGPYLRAYGEFQTWAKIK
jgi:hypothetical protein